MLHLPKNKKNVSSLNKTITNFIDVTVENAYMNWDLSASVLTDIRHESQHCGPKRYVECFSLNHWLWILAMANAYFFTYTIQSRFSLVYVFVNIQVPNPALFHTTIRQYFLPQIINKIINFYTNVIIYIVGFPFSYHIYKTDHNSPEIQN